MIENQFDEYALTYPTGSKDELPSLIRIGSYKRYNAEDVPVMLPLEAINGLCFVTNAQTRDDALRQMQYIALSLLKQVSPELLKFTFVDMGVKNNFPLQSLKEYNLKFIKDVDNLKREIETLANKAREISTCFGGEYRNLKEYNQNTEHKEPYHILFIANFPNKFSEEEINSVNELINECADYGIRIIMNLDKEFYPDDKGYDKNRFAKLYAIPNQMVHLDCTLTIKKKNDIFDW